MPRGQFITYIDMTQGKRAVIGFKAHAYNRGSDAAGEGVKESANVNANDSASDNVVAAPETAAAKVAVADTNRRAPETKKQSVQTANRTRAEKETKSKDAKKPQAGGTAAARTSERTTATGQTRGGIERPRRVGRSG